MKLEFKSKKSYRAGILKEIFIWGIKVIGGPGLKKSNFCMKLVHLEKSGWGCTVVARPLFLRPCRFFLNFLCDTTL